MVMVMVMVVMVIWMMQNYGGYDDDLPFTSESVTVKATWLCTRKRRNSNFVMQR
jgi:hypothetical protein